MRVGRYGPYVQRDDDETASLPPEIAPDELTVELALELIAKQAEGPEGARHRSRDRAARSTCSPVASARTCSSASRKTARRRSRSASSLFASQTPETVTLDEALQLLSLPRVVGTDGEGREIVASPGRFGPYLKRADGDTRSLAAEEQLLTVTLDEAEALYAQPKQRRGRQQKPPIAELGAHPDIGRAGARARRSLRPVRHRRHVNATVPRGTDPAELTLDEAVALLRAHAPRPRRTKAKKAAKKTAKKADEEDREEGGEEGRAKKAAKKADDEGGRRRSRPIARQAGERMRPARLTARVSEQAPFIPADPDDATDPPPPRSVFRVPGFMRLFGSRSSCRASATGSGSFAILALATKVSSSGTAVGLVMIARMLPGFLLAPFGGALVDRWNRKVVMVTLRHRPRRRCSRCSRSSTTCSGSSSSRSSIEVLTLLWGPAKDATRPEHRQGSRAARVRELARRSSRPTARSRSARSCSRRSPASRTGSAASTRSRASASTTRSRSRSGSTR